MPSEHSTRVGKRERDLAEYHLEQFIHYFNMMKDDTTPVVKAEHAELPPKPSDKYASQRKATVCSVLKSMYNGDPKGTRQQFGDHSAFMNALKSKGAEKNTMLMKFF